MTTITPSLTLGDPQVAGPLAVFPVLGPEPALDYRAFATASGSAPSSRSSTKARPCAT